MTVLGAGISQFEFDGERRIVLSGFAAVCLAAFLRPVVAKTDALHQVFLDFSRFLTGRAFLDVEQSARLFEAFTSVTPDIGTSVEQLFAWIQEKKVDLVRLQQALDEEGSPHAGLPRQVMRAWYTGIVGDDAAARCVTFETSLMHQLVADQLSPPSYCYGPHGSWAVAPV